MYFKRERCKYKKCIGALVEVELEKNNNALKITFFVQPSVFWMGHPGKEILP